MKKDFISKITQILESAKNEIIKKQLEIVDIDTSGDEVDIVQSSIILHNHKQLISRDQNKLKQIEATFNRIKEDTFGVCASCGEEIPEKRLLFNPMFLNCIICAEQLEFQERNYRKS